MLHTLPERKWMAGGGAKAAGGGGDGRDRGDTVEPRNERNRRRLENRDGAH